MHIEDEIHAALDRAGVPRGGKVGPRREEVDELPAVERVAVLDHRNRIARAMLDVALDGADVDAAARGHGVPAHELREALAVRAASK